MTSHFGVCGEGSRLAVQADNEDSLTFSLLPLQGLPPNGQSVIPSPPLSHTLSSPLTGPAPQGPVRDPLPSSLSHSLFSP
jgi:hypothetical protein